MATISKDKHHATRQLISPVLTLICLGIMFLLNWLCPLVSIVRPPVNLSGLLVIGIGFGVCFTAHGQFKRVGTTLYPFNEPGKLVTDGLFRYTRNPMYLGLSVFLAGAWLLLGSLSPLGVVAAFLLIADRWYIAYEEKRLAAVFGKAYKDYQANTPRWI